MEKHFGDDKTEHAVAQEFEPLVGRLVARARMGERALQELPVGEDVTELFFQPGKACRLSQ